MDFVSGYEIWAGRCDRAHPCASRLGAGVDQRVSQPEPVVEPAPVVVATPSPTPKPSPSPTATPSQSPTPVPIKPEPVEDLAVQVAAEEAKSERDRAAAQALADEQAWQEEQLRIADEQAQAAAAMDYVEPQGGYSDGTCASLSAAGLGGNFVPGDANYTDARDRDGDGVACES